MEYKDITHSMLNIWSLGISDVLVIFISIILAY
jgi:hypothetical protein